VNRFLDYTDLNSNLKDQYNVAISKAFPQIISESEVIKSNWPKLENYFPQYQKFLVTETNQLIGFINSIPFQFNEPLDQLPAEGWDWMFEKGIYDFENHNEPNYLGGLQVIIPKKFQGLGYSKQILNHAKTVFKANNFLNLIIPIRPIKKREFPEMPMSTYMHLTENGEIFDPWIRTHLKGGAELLKVCERSMTMEGDIKFWESMLDQNITKSGKYELQGALELIKVDLENNKGQYIEPNIWIKYD